jgi:ComF family protein
VGRVTRHQVLGCGCCGDDLNLDIDMEDARFAGMLAQRLLCRECRMAAPEFERAVAYGSYNKEMRSLIAELKFNRVRGVAPLLGRRMAEAILTLEGEAGAELLVVAVPLFKTHESRRGYNQSVLLANEALHWLKRLRPHWKLVPAHAALERRKSTESSFVLSRQGRRRNLKGAFKVSGDVRRKEVLLIDDILTSGATARECARVLRAAGATKVWVATLARAQRRSAKAQQDDPSELVATWDMAAVQTF